MDSNPEAIAVMKARLAQFGVTLVNWPPAAPD